MTEMNNSGGASRPGPSAADIAPTSRPAGRWISPSSTPWTRSATPSARPLTTTSAALPEAERESFQERVRQARETLAMSFTAEEEPPADLFARIVAQLPAAAPAAAGRAVPSGETAAGARLPACSRAGPRPTSLPLHGSAGKHDAGRPAPALARRRRGCCRDRARRRGRRAPTSPTRTIRLNQVVRAEDVAGGVSRRLRRRHGDGPDFVVAVTPWWSR